MSDGLALRMLDERERLQPNQRADIIERFFRFIEKHGYRQKYGSPITAGLPELRTPCPE